MELFDCQIEDQSIQSAKRLQRECQYSRVLYARQTSGGVPICSLTACVLALQDVWAVPGNRLHNLADRRRDHSLVDHERHAPSPSSRPFRLRRIEPDRRPNDLNSSYLIPGFIAEPHRLGIWIPELEILMSGHHQTPHNSHLQLEG